jgi:hypothetical protein
MIKVAEGVTTSAIPPTRMIPAVEKTREVEPAVALALPLRALVGLILG